MDNELEVVTNEGLATVEEATMDQTKSLLVGGACGLAIGAGATIGIYYLIKLLRSKKAKKAEAEESEDKSEE